MHRSRTSTTNRPVRRGMFLVMILGTLWLAGCSGMAHRLADAVYPSLDRPVDKEAPPTVAQFPPTSEIVALLGGKGEGLSCSLPGWAEALFFARGERQAPISLQFRQACVYHDLCYRHGAATYDYSQRDCDDALQSQAYRLCRQFERDKNNPGAAHLTCEAEAKSILLAVQLFGARAFQSGGDSTYHEFDPIPAEADDYVIGRALRQTVGEDGLRLHPLTLHFKRHSMVKRDLKWGSDPDNEPMASRQYDFQRKVVATPPMVVPDHGTDKLISLTRNGFHDTGGSIVVWPTANDTASVASLDKGDYSQNLLETDSGGQARLLRVSHRLTKQCGDSDSEASLGFISYALAASNPEPAKCRVPERHWASVRDTDTGQAETHKDAYRYLQHPPLLGRFTHIDNQLLVWSRGLGANGESYQKKVKYLLFQRGGQTSEQLPLRTFELTEDQEPVVSIPLGQGRSVLFSAQAGRRTAGAVASSPEFYVLSFDANGMPEPWRRVSFPSGELDNSWLHQQIQFVRTGLNSNDVYAFFSRVCSAASDNEHDAGACQWPVGNRQPYVQDAVSLEFKYFGLREVAVAEKLPNLEFVPMGSIIHRVKLAPDDKNDAAQRWRNSQVLPGHFFSDEGPLDIAVIHKGFPAKSVWLRGCKKAVEKNCDLAPVSHSAMYPYGKRHENVEVK